MGHSDAHSGILVKMTKCRPYVHTCACREGVADTPTVHASKLAPVHSSSSAQRGPIPDILNGLEIERFLGDYD